VDLVTGSTTPKARAKVLDEWKYGDPTEKRILVATMASMSAACNLVTAEAAYFVEYDWAPLNVAQAEKRHHRPGNRFGTVWAYYFHIQNTLETKMLDTLLSKLENQEQAIPSEDQREQFQQIMGRSEALDYEDILNSVALELMEEEE
jgi:SNF2 family DNA or RNA helicase